MDIDCGTPVSDGDSWRGDAGDVEASLGEVRAFDAGLVSVDGVDAMLRGAGDALGVAMSPRCMERGESACESFSIGGDVRVEMYEWSSAWYCGTVGTRAAENGECAKLVTRCTVSQSATPRHAPQCRFALDRVEMSP